MDIVPPKFIKMLLREVTRSDIPSSAELQADLMRLSFSIVVPTFNEEGDIAGTLDALLALDYPHKEIIVVDDSSDRTPDIVRSYFDLGVKLVHPGGGGRCEARNTGIMLSTGVVLCILNADVRPRPDFLHRLAVHYHGGADYVLVRSRASNRRTSFGRYLASLEDRGFLDPKWMEWTEGFSCRRALAVSAGLFPVGFPSPICAGEDGYFAGNLRRLASRKVIDLSLTVDHVVPDSLRAFWLNRVGRGVGAVQIRRFLHGWSYGRLTVWAGFKCVISFLEVILLVPLFMALGLCRFSEKGLSDWPAFAVIWTLERAAFESGEWTGLLRMRRREQVARYAVSKGLQSL